MIVGLLAESCKLKKATMKYTYSLWSYGVKEEKTFSEEIARFFEIADCIFFLIPNTLLLASNLIYIVIVLLFYPYQIGTGFYWFIGFVLLLLVRYVWGCLLFYGFFQHSRGILSKSKIKWLWIGTIAYSMTNLGFILWTLRQLVPVENLISVEFWMRQPIWFLALCVWYVAVCGLSIFCIKEDDLFKNNDSVP